MKVVDTRAATDIYLFSRSPLSFSLSLFLLQKEREEQRGWVYLKLKLLRRAFDDVCVRVGNCYFYFVLFENS